MNKAIESFASAMDRVFREEPDDAARWQRVGTLMPILLEDEALRTQALTWPLTQTPAGYANLLLYEDPSHGFVINALVKGPRVGTPIHDHAHTWTAYGVLTGTERVVRYNVVAHDDARDEAQLEPATEYDVAPGYVDVVPPNEPHAEFSGDERTVAIIVRSERLGSFTQKMYDAATGKIQHRPGPEQIPHLLN
jgi:predicted metal-dependent enzyme (double-stranded beta helix superfamily)